MEHAVLQGGAPVRYTKRFFEDEDGTQHPLKPRTRAGKLKLGVYEIERQNDVPQGHVRTGSELVLGDGVVIAQVTYEAKSVTDYRAEVQAKADRTYSRVMSPIAQVYPPEEREGWSEQVAAAQEVLAGGQNDLIDALRSATGETATDMAQRIITKRSEYLTLYGAATAARRGLNAQIAAATTHADLDAIDVIAAFGL